VEHDQAGAILLDLDGTLFDAGTAIPGAADAITQLRADGRVVRFLTNTDSRSSSSLLTMLKALELDVREGELFTPVVAATAYLGRADDAGVLLLVNDEVRGDLIETNRVVPHDRATEATHVVVGDIRRELDYHALDAAYRAVAAGAELIALHKGRYLKAADGGHLDTGAVVAAIEYASETRATVVGKPSRLFLQLAVASVPADLSMSDVWVVGDDRTTDVLMGEQAGAHTVAVRTGKYPDQTGRADYPDAEHVIDSVAGLPELLRTSLR